MRISRKRVWDAVRGYCKSDHTVKLLGYEKLEDIKLKYLPYLQKTADDRYGVDVFDINNFSGYDWQVHHKVPVEEFNMMCYYHQRLCFNWSNTEILSIKDHKAIHKMKIDYCQIVPSSSTKTSLFSMESSKIIVMP
jgi:hypothetical protein